MTEEQCRKNGGHRWDIKSADEDDHEYVRIWFECEVCGKTYDTNFHKALFTAYFQERFDEELFKEDEE